MEVKDYQKGLLIIHTFVLQLFHTLRTEKLRHNLFFLPNRLKIAAGSTIYVLIYLNKCNLNLNCGLTHSAIKMVYVNDFLRKRILRKVLV